MTYGKRGLIVRSIYLFVAILFFVASKIKGENKRKSIVLCYHGVNEFQRLSFLKQLSVLKTHAVVTKDVAAITNQHAKNMSVCLTFDDAFANLLLNVIPGITEMQMPITIFVPTGSLGAIPSWLCESEHFDRDERVMSVDQLLILKENHLVQFGSHTVDHPRLSLLKDEEIRKQLRVSKNVISGIIGKKITELALPHGDFNEVVIQIALDEGYNRIYTLEPVAYDAKSDPCAHLIGRFSVSPDDWPIEFFLTIAGGYAWLAPWRSFLHNIRK
jgi:peptidoglycan/xylan/chitin deacetylase (PgdA/CDA1 family)